MWGAMCPVSHFGNRLRLVTIKRTRNSLKNDKNLRKEGKIRNNIEYDIGQSAGENWHDRRMHRAPSKYARTQLGHVHIRINNAALECYIAWKSAKDQSRSSDDSHLLQRTKQFECYPRRPLLCLLSHGVQVELNVCSSTIKGQLGFLAKLFCYGYGHPRNSIFLSFFFFFFFLIFGFLYYFYEGFFRGLSCFKLVPEWFFFHYNNAISRAISLVMRIVWHVAQRLYTFVFRCVFRGRDNFVLECSIVPIFFSFCCIFNSWS